MDIEFKGFPKIPRLSRDCIITEKIDGTNAQIIIEEYDQFKHLNPLDVVEYIDPVPVVSDGLVPEHVPIHRVAVYAGSKSRVIYPGKQDNYGFAAWVQEHAHELARLGPGRHFGEWWGQGIQRSYGLREKRFSLFNVSRWRDWKPSCCHVVPVMYEGEFKTIAVDNSLSLLACYGSMAAPGFMNPEGVVIFHIAANSYFKKTLFHDEAPKGKGEE